MKTIKIAILCCDWMGGEEASSEWLNQMAKTFGNDDSWFKTFFTDTLGPQYGRNVECEVFDCWKQHLPRDPKAFDGLLVTGSRFGANDEHVPWVNHLIQYLQNVYREKSCRIVGVCFGHQITCKALGGRVNRNPKGIEEGVVEVSLSSELQKYFKTDKSMMRLLMGHEDQVCQVPLDTTMVLGPSAMCEVQGIIIRDRVFTIQAHPEMPPAMAEAMIDARFATRDAPSELYYSAKAMDDATYQAYKAGFRLELDSEWIGLKILQFIAGEPFEP
jgi:GMP synthase-like glutamine amidotransferase